MNQQAELNAVARAIIDFNLYMVLGTADESGQPWVTPVYYAAADYIELGSARVIGSGQNHPTIVRSARADQR
jgi:hypothetical protein